MNLSHGKTTLIAWFLLIVFVMMSTSVAKTETPLVGSNDFIEDFNDSTIQSPWFWIREDSSAWSLSERPGFLRIRTQEGTLDQNSVFNNLLLRPSVNTNYILTIRVDFLPIQNFHEASIYLYADDDNWIKLSRLFQDTTLSGDVYLFAHERNGTFHPGFVVPANETISELRISVVGHSITASFKESDGYWTTIGALPVDDPSQFSWIGVAAYHGEHSPQPTSITVDFDFVALQELDQSVYIPVIFR